ncbi:MAG TPA: efflux RND transporter periplasmic adaptor subunit [Alphaproteobacteria bacterium]|nr:efflux RND transporter periplasmic adaptor subunit [Alphaproteobacteria bacterium]
MRRRGVRVALLIVLGVVVGAWGMQWFVAYKMQSMAAAAKGGARMKMVTPVEAASVKAMDVNDVVQVPGSISADMGTVLRPEVPGVVKAIAVHQGVEVSAGTVLVQLDDATERADANQALAALRLNERSWKRVQALRAEDAALVSQKDFDTAQSNFESARAAYQAARTRVEKMAITAPFAGVAGLNQVNPGDYVAVGQALISLQTLRDLRVDFALPERFSGSIEPGQDITVRVTALGTSVSATIVAADPLLDAASRNLPVRAKIDNAGGTIRPGMFGDVTMSRGNLPGALMIPEAALMPEGEKQFVYKFAGNPSPTVPGAVSTPGDTAQVAQKVEVTTGLRLNGMVQVVSGLVSGDTVVSAGQMKIGPGSPIVAMNIGMAPVSATAVAPAVK